jgi:hypothetical protein
VGSGADSSIVECFFRKVRSAQLRHGQKIQEESNFS